MESMLNTKAPSQVNFKIEEIDEPISNMEELIKQHMSQRELDIPAVSSMTYDPTSSGLLHHPQSLPVEDRPALGLIISETSKIVILEELDKSSVRDVQNVNAPLIHISDKHVSFDEGQIDHDKEIRQLKTQIETLQTEVSELKTMMRDFLDKVSKSNRDPNEVLDVEPEPEPEPEPNLSNVESET